MIPKYRKQTTYYVNNRFKTLGILAQITKLEPPCSVVIWYRHENEKKMIEAIIDEYVPLGVKCKFRKC